MHEDENYRYPDSNEKLNRPSDEGYWEQSEIRLISETISQLTKTSRQPGDMHMLDAGCGDGRLIGYYEPFFSEIIAIDPDVQRLRHAQERAQYWGCSSKCKFEPWYIQQLNDRFSFDFILCNHVLEHLSVPSLTQTLSIISNTLKEDGLALLTTAHSQGDDHFIKVYQDESKQTTSKNIDQAEFNMLCDRPVEGTLPVNKSKFDTFKSLLNSNELEVIFCKVYQVAESFGDFGTIYFKDNIVNSDDRLRNRFGQNMAFLCKSKRG